ncbi:TrkH family potassium uptake protein [Magnetospirillum sp. UT-4]|uniref:TrkH family potassium uptake protein n=1 Tax=Magnetospirillum sp. UT-4 TaxID=2681467 RepID=UPI0013833B0A|nr:TrkH family potassium uptake protein [Magnetospirillum sp. UT-4]CAA7618815.1 Trk system potassium uptake protein [Magnetospirillum sp. UT-4]
MIDFRPVIFVNGILLLVLAAAMAVPALVDLASDDLDWQVFALSGIVTAFVGLAMMLATRRDDRPPFSTRQAFLLTTSVWVLMAGFAALPFSFSALGMSFTDGYFEAMSGLTTTGSTVIAGLDTAPRGILMWRALLHWLGGVGIIVMAVAILPILRIGGMQLFKMESSDKTEKVKPRTSQVASGIVVTYVGLTLVCGILLWWAGMTPFEAVCHAMSALSTGGFSTSDGSAGHWSSPLVHWILIVGMAAGGTTFVLFITPWRRGRWAILTDTQVRWFLAFLGFFSVVLALWQWIVNDMDAGEALTHASFTVVSLVTTTGFASTDYSLWGGFPQVVAFVLTFIGGCTGSTAGGVKVFRWQVLFQMAGTQLKRLLHPHGVFVIDFNRQRISDAVVDSVLGFVVVYFLTFSLFALALTVTGLDLVTAVTGSAQAISNVGPGLGDIIGPAGNFKPLPDAAKWLLSFEMMLGRLELFTVIVLFSRTFWRV